MRLIDADEFAAEMRKRQDAAEAWKREATDAESAARADAILTFLCEVKLTLDKMPTVDAVPVRNGRWEKVEVMEAKRVTVASMFCPVCKRYHNEVYLCGNPTELVMYCPCCGAKKDGGEDG